MGRPLRWIPPHSLVEVTSRTIHGRFLLRPSRDLNEIVIGILGRAQLRYDVRLCAFIFLSNHSHLLTQPADALELAGFMDYVNGNLAKEAGRLHNWREKIWGRRYRAIVVSDDEETQTERLRYMLENGCKENLVRKPQDWPGASSTDALLTGHPLRGIWFDRTAEHNARRRGERVSKYDYAEELELRLSPLPAWKDRYPGEIRRKVLEIVRSIEADTRRKARDTGIAPLGVRRIRRQDPHSAPNRPSRSPAPRFHARAPRVRKGLELAYHAFRIAYQQAAEALRNGRIDAEFPAGCFRPPLPFTRARAGPVRA
jgi:REP element-mobilizing transposase RayT